MTRKKIPILFTVLILSTLFIAVSLGPNIAPLMPSSPSQVQPQRHLAPPANQSGIGSKMDLTESVNDNRTINLMANDTRAQTTYRNATFSGEQLNGFTKFWQNLTMTKLQATYDARAVQGGSSSTEYLPGRNQTGSNQGLAIRFVTVDKVNLTGIWMYYSLGGSSSIPFTINVTTTNSKTPSGSSSVGGGSIPATGGLDGWYYVQLSSPLTLVRGNYYWLMANASALNNAFFDWYYIRDQGGEDGIYCSAYRTLLDWYNEAQMISAGWVPAYFNLMLVLKVIPVDDSLNIKQYSSPRQVNMYLNSTGNPINANSSRISNTYNTFVLCTNTSVTFTARWDARFEKTQTGVAATNFRAENGLTFWNVTFTSGTMPANSYTMYNRTLRIFTVPTYWAIQPSNVSNTGTVASFTPYFTLGSGYVFIVQGGNPDVDPWADTWLIKAKSSYKVTATLPSQVVAGLSLTVGVSTVPYSPSWCNVTFYNPAGNPAYSRNVTVPSTSFQLTLKLNDSGINMLLLFDKWTGGNEVSFNNTLTVNVLPPDCNLTVNDRTSPVIGNTAMLRFKFYNNSLGKGNTVIQYAPEAVSVNGTLTTNFNYDLPSGNLSVYMNTGSGAWRTGNNTVVVSAKSGVFNATKQTWILVLEPLCNITVVGRTSPVIGNAAGLQFKFYNNSLGTGNSVIQPDSVDVNKTFVPFDYNGTSGVVSVSLSTASGGWHVGNNTILISAEKGVFYSTLTTWILVQGPLCNVTVISISQPFPSGNSASLSFKFYNNTVGANPLLINPTSVRINGTDASFTYSGGAVTTNWSILTGGWHLGLNHVNVSATSGIFTNFAVVPITLGSPLCNVTLFGSISSPILGNLATAQFRFLNGTNGWATMSPITVKINGTSRTFTCVSGIATVSWDTSSGGWRSGLNHVDITAISGVFLNSTVYQFTIIAPNAALAVNATTYSATYGDDILVGFTFLNTTGAPRPFPSPPILYRNGTTVSLIDLGGGLYAYPLGTRYFTRAGEFHVNFTARYGAFYIATNITAVVVSKITMTFNLSLGETSVTAGSSLSASVTLKYPNGTAVEDMTNIIFTFTVTYANGSVNDYSVTAVTLGGTCSASFVTNRDMKEISVEAIYDDPYDIRNFASRSVEPVAVTLPVGGFPVIFLAGAGGIGALVVGLSVVAVRRRRRGKEIEYKKTAALRQAASLAQLVVVDRKSGRAVFSKNLSTDETVDPHLISGFLSANESILQEVFRGDKECLRYADYGKYKVITCVGENVMTTLFCAVGADKQLEGVLELEDVLAKFNKEFERKYGRLVSVWDGDMVAFKGADSIVSEVFAQGISMLSPYTLDHVALARTKMSGLENDAFEKASKLSSGRGLFFITKVIEYLLAEKGVNRGKVMDTINSLVKKGVFKQISMSEAEEIVKQAASAGAATSR